MLPTTCSLCAAEHHDLGMGITLLVNKADASNKVTSISQGRMLSRREACKRCHSRLNYSLLKMCYVIGACIAIVHVMSIDFCDHTGRFSADQMLDFCSWLFISIGFCIPILCFLCLPTNKYVEIGPAATDAFLYGLIFGILKFFQGPERATCLGSASAPILFGLVGLLLVQIEQSESFDTQNKDDIVFVI